MKCYNHPEKDAIAQCGSCGKGLCEECAKKWNPPICDDCQSNNINADLTSVNRELMLYVGLAVFGAIFGAMFASGFSPDFSHTVYITAMYACAFPSYAAGWKWMNHITDKFTLFATPVGWFIYLFIKLMFSAAIGVFALPYRVYRINKRKKELNSLLSYMQQ